MNSILLISSNDDYLDSKMLTLNSRFAIFHYFYGVVSHNFIFYDLFRGEKK